MSPHVPLPPLMGLEILLASPNQSDHDSLSGILRSHECNLHWSRTCGEAVSFLREHRVGVIIASTGLPDGTWKSLLSEISLSADAPNLIVTSRLADERLWAEILNLGGYDLLVVPYDADEVLRIAVQAWLDWDQKRTLRNQKATATSQGSFDLAGRVAAIKHQALKGSAAFASGSRGNREENVSGHQARQSSRWMS